MKPDFSTLFDAVLRQVEQGADPFAAARAEGVAFRDLYAWCRDQAAPGYHPYALLLDARAEWLSARTHACYDRLAERVDQRLVRHRDVAEVERDAITALMAEARDLRRWASDLRTFGTMPKEVMEGYAAVAARPSSLAKPKATRKKAAAKNPDTPAGPYIGVAGPMWF